MYINKIGCLFYNFSTFQPFFKDFQPFLIRKQLIMLETIEYCLKIYANRANKCF